MAINTAKRCKKIGTDGVGASGACPVTCGTCLKCEEACCDSATWSYNAEWKNCGWVGAKRHRCWLTSAGSAGVRALEACPVSCGTCSMVARIVDQDSRINVLAEALDATNSSLNAAHRAEKPTFVVFFERVV